MLAKVGKEVPAGLQVRSRRKLPAHARFHVQFTPTSASWLNLVERWFAELAQKQQLKRGVHRSVQAL
ncbi:hypothetical protein AB0D83_01840 [Streptomyces decoyicus]|uniref:hypothetical protein n=1 Tax=Streptomyces decoyicus TaxID=249567 RepID=UPI0033F73B8E